MGRIAVVGSANMDLVVRTPHFAQPGETCIGSDFHVTPGGKGANQAVAAAKLGGDTLFVGAVGSDAFGKGLLDSLHESGTDTEYIKRTSGSSGVAVITVTHAGENSIIVAPGANFEVTAADVSAALSAKQPAWVLTQFEVPEEAVLACRGFGKLIVNPAPARRIPQELLSSIEILTPNETEFEELSGVVPSSLEQIQSGSQGWLDAGVRHVIVTLGAQGVAWVSAAGIRAFPAYSVDVVDTTGAGDAFNGALVTYLSQGIELEQAIPRAILVAALACTRKGAQSAMPSQAEADLAWQNWNSNA